MKDLDLYDKNKIEFEYIDSIEKLKSIIEYIKENIYFTIDILNPNIYSKMEIDKIYMKSQNKNYIIMINKLLQIDEKNTIYFLKMIFENEDIHKISYDNKISYISFNKLGINIKGFIFDVKIAAYLIDSSKGEYELLTLIQEYLKTDIKENGDELKIKMTSYLEELKEILSSKITEYNMEKLLYEVEQPLTEILASMEAEGFKVESAILDELGEKFKNEINLVQKEIYDLAGEEFNINSPKQLGKILFEKLDLPVIKKQKLGIQQMLKYWKNYLISIL